MTTSPTDPIVHRKRKRRERANELATRAFYLAEYLSDRGMTAEAAAAANLAVAIHELVCVGMAGDAAADAPHFC